MKIFSYFYNFKRTTRKLVNSFCNVPARNLKYSRGNFLFKLLGLSSIALITFKLSHQETFAKSKIIPDEKLISVIMITRHGARTPLKIVSKLDEVEYPSDLLLPYVNAKFKLQHLDGSDFDHDLLSYYDQLNMRNVLKGGIGRGQLTKVGEKQMFNLGRRVRSRYIDELKFLDPNYNTNEFYTRSTHYRRTIHSAKSVLAGIYLESENKDDNLPFIINVQQLHEDVLFPNAINCSYFAEMFKFVETLSLYSENKDYIKNLVHLNEAIKGSSEIEDQKNVTFTAFMDDMRARQVHGLHVPTNLEEFISHCDKYAAMELTAETQHNIKISCGRLLRLFKENLIESYENDSSSKKINVPKFRYYSAHDSTLNALLVAFNLIDEYKSWPPFGADITLELWKKLDENETLPNRYFVRAFYCGKRVFLPGCLEKECSLEHFFEILDKNSVDKHGYDLLCHKKFN